MNTGKITAPFRKLGLIHVFDKVKFRYIQAKNKKLNQAFAKKYPDVVLPPDYLIFETFHLNYNSYYFGGQESAKDIVEEVKPYIDLNQKKILDWGCGPGRIIRHMHRFVEGSDIHGVDYNPTNLNWCAKHIPNVTFSKNEVNPPLAYAEGVFDFIYGISIFTHLSEPNHTAWMAELARICKSGGVVFLTSHGPIFKRILTEEENKRYDQGQIVTRGKAFEGHRVYAAFHPPSYFRALLEVHFEVLEYSEGKEESWGINQDHWIVRKR